jgi:glutathione S-transferase
MVPTITAFQRPPDRGRALTRDLCVKWALEEVGQPYAVRHVSFREIKESQHRALNPFGTIPTYEEGSLVLFESGAIVLHIAQSHAGLLPVEPAQAAKAISWIFAALNTIEPPLAELEKALRLKEPHNGYEDTLHVIEKRLRVRLTDVSSALGDAEWLDGKFSAGDLMVVSILRRWIALGIPHEFPNLANYVVRGEARPAFQRALRVTHR